MLNHNLINKTTAYLLENLNFYFISDFHKLVYSNKYTQRIQHLLHLICKNMSEYNQGVHNYFLKDHIRGYVSDILNEGEDGIKCCCEILGEPYQEKLKTDVIPETKQQLQADVNIAKSSSNTCVNKYKKKPISATIKRLVWNMHIGEEIGKAKCLCCNVTEITQMSFNCGHILAEANGGETFVSNLKPICQNCNSSMGTKNMDDFMKSLG
jgi:hypothetical protein